MKTIDLSTANVRDLNQALRAGDRRFVPPMWAVEVARMLCPSIYGPLEARLRALPEFP